jgi:phosphoribosylformylglycinamidine synthase
MKARVTIDVMLKDGILDPQGKTVEENLPSLGYTGVSGVRVGKHVEMVIEGDSVDAIRAEAEEMTRRFLSNPVIEDATVTVEGATGA